MMRRSSFRHRLFSIAQVLIITLFVIPPFIITSNGNNMVRFSFDTVELYLFNNIVGFNNFFTMSVGILLFVFVFILFTQVFGRIWCGWLCPQSVFLDIIGKITSKVGKRFKLIIDITLSAIFSLIFTLILMFYFVSPYNFLSELFGEYSYVMMPAFIIMFIFFFVDFWLVKYKWCKYICPYAKLQAVMNDNDTLYIGMLKDEDSKCIKCLSCVKHCPVEIDPRLTPSSECIYCEACIRECEKVLSKRGYKSILGYNWGQNFQFTPFRINVIITGMISILLLVYLIYLLFFNAPFKVDYGIDKLSDTKGVAFLDIKNRKNDTIILSIKADGKVITSGIILKAKGRYTADVPLIMAGDGEEYNLVFQIEESNGYKKDIELLIK